MESTGLSLASLLKAAALLDANKVPTNNRKVKLYGSGKIVMGKTNAEFMGIKYHKPCSTTH